MDESREVSDETPTPSDVESEHIEKPVKQSIQQKRLDATEYWRRNVSLMIKLGVIWFLVSYGFGILLVDELNAIRLGGYKLGFWFAQQGSIYTFIALIFYYTRAMERLDREFGVEEED